MPLVTLTARETIPYAGIIRRVGTRFDAESEDARILVLAGKADRYRAPQQTSNDPASGESVDQSDTSEQSSRRRRSQRKDIVPES